MTRLEYDAIHRRAQQLRREELARIAGVLKLEWSTWIQSVVHLARKWHAHARNLLPGSPGTPNG